MPVRHQRLVAAVAAVVLALLSTAVPLLGLVLELAAVACVAYLAASFAIEQLLDEREDRTSAAAARAVQRRTAARRGRSVSQSDVRTAIGDGAGTARELAEVLEVHEYVARRMLDALAEDGQVEVIEGYARLRRPVPAAVPRGPRWIDTPDVD